MPDEKKIKDKQNLSSEELTDEQADNVTGGASFFCDFTCSECGKYFSGAHPFNIGGKRYCATCYSNLVQGQEQPQRRNSKLS